jgi:hypothetical protein
MRGQYLTIEYVLFFAFGVVMTISIYLAFSGIAGNIRDASMVAQFQRTGEAIRGTTIDIFETARSTNSNISYNISIPLRLSACTYAISVSGQNMNINCTDNYKLGTILDLYGLPVQSLGTIYSSRGYIEVDANRTHAILG